MKTILLFFLFTIFSVHSAEEQIICKLDFGNDSVAKQVVVSVPGENQPGVELKIKKVSAKINAKYVLGEENVSLSFEFKTKRKFISKTVGFSRDLPLKIEQERAVLTCKDENLFDDVLGRNAKVFALAKNDPNSFMGNETLLYFAAKNNNERIVNSLLTLNANPLIPNKSGNLPLMAAAAFGNEKVLKSILLSGRSALNQINKNGWNALIFAAKNNNLPALNYLLENGIILDQQDKSGRTALMIASKMGFDKVVNRLIQSGANLELKRNNGMTAYMLAYKYGHNGIQNLLRSAGASDFVNLDLPVDFDWDLENEENYYNR
jgi:hypothetical protein